MSQNWLCVVCVGCFLLSCQLTRSEATDQLVNAHVGRVGEDNFDILLQETNSRLQGKLDLASLNELLDRLNEKCLKAASIFRELGISDVTQGMTVDQFVNASLIITYYLKRDNENVTCNASEPVPSPSNVAQQLFTSNQVCADQFASILRAVVTNGRTYTNEDNDKSFGPLTLLPECTSDRNTIYAAVADMVISLARGMTILPGPEFFKESLFEYLDGTSQGYITEESFEDLLIKFEIGGTDDHDDHDHKDETADHDDDGDDREGETRAGNMIVNGKRRKRNLDDDDGENKCFSASELLAIVGKRSNGGDVIITSNDLTNLCPAILQQFVTGACAEKHSNDVTVDDPSYTKAMKYGYGTVAVFLISLLAFGGLLLFPSIGSTYYKMIMQFFIALGVGTLSGDALLHLIPEVLGLHGHAEGESHDHEGMEEDRTYVYQLLVVVAGIYVFYLFENVLRLWNQIRGTNISFHHHGDHHSDGHHHHGGKDASTHHTITRHGNEDEESQERNSEEKEKDRPSIDKFDMDEKDKKDPRALICGVTPVGIMVLIGDMLHNFGDGLALGVAFSSSWVGGLGTSIAIFCHELPHEFGDFAIYMKNGMSKWKALSLNFMAACCAFIGLYIGLSVGENPNARRWMLAVIAGMFLYIALVDVLHEMIEESSQHPLLDFLLQNIGLCLGWAILLLLALYEETIKTAIGG